MIPSFYNNFLNLLYNITYINKGGFVIWMKRCQAMKFLMN